MRQTSRSRGQHERRGEPVARAREHLLVEVGERDDQPDAVLGDECGERVDVARVVDPRDEGAAVGVVERRRERVEVGREGRRAGPPEGA